MMTAGDFARHEEAWLLLPWLANGRISPADRDKIEEHVRSCTACTKELAFQRLVCRALTEPDRVTYAPGPSFRKLMDRIDGVAPSSRSAPSAPPPRDIADAAPSAPSRLAGAAASGTASGRFGTAVWWRPPGLAWAASFVLVLGVTAIVGSTVYRWSEPRFVTHTDTTPTQPNVLQIAFDRSLTIGAVEEVLRSAGAHVVQGPDSTGIFGVTPASAASGHLSGPAAAREMQVLSARLRADPRVRWVQPLPGSEGATDGSPGTHRGM
jgi:hypothetical protein